MKLSRDPERNFFQETSVFKKIEGLPGRTLGVISGAITEGIHGESPDDFLEKPPEKFLDVKNWNFMENFLGVIYVLISLKVSLGE